MKIKWLQFLKGLSGDVGIIPDIIVQRFFAIDKNTYINIYFANANYISRKENN
jgi:hypothetical protein